MPLSSREAVAKTPEEKLATKWNAGKHDGAFEKACRVSYPVGGVKKGY
jgi:hypothetical protein